jgi:hypothetical protein
MVSAMSDDNSDANNMTQIGIALRDHLFGRSYDHGMVGIGTNNFHVYIFNSEKRWRGNKPTEWHGIPIEYHWNVGRPRALAEARP